MAAVQARALYDFESGAPGELAFYAQEVLTIVRQDVGAGWWEAKNASGKKGLVPESYLEITSFAEPLMPPPPAPPAYAAAAPPTQRGPGPWSSPATPSSPTNSSGGGTPSWAQPSRAVRPNALGRPPPPQVRPGGVGGRVGGAGVGGGAESNDGWDDDDWDDDDESTVGGGTPEGSEWGGGAHDESSGRGVVRRDSKAFGAGGSVRKPFSRFSTFYKAGGDAYLFDSLSVIVPESERRAVIYETVDGPVWRAVDPPIQVSIKSHKKETKYYGIKAFIAYQLTPTFSNIQVSRRYKQFDWLQKRLVEKYSTMAVPPLPEKQIAGRFEEDFVSVRLKQLQLWMDRMCKHPVVAQSEVFHHFLTCTDEKKWTTGKRKAEKDEFMGGKFFLTVKPPATPLDRGQAEQMLDKFGKFVRSMDDSARHLYAVGESNIKKHQGPFKKEYQKLGGSFLTLAASFKFDARPSAQGLTQAIEATGHAYNRIGDLFAAQPQNDMFHLMEGLLEYKGILSTFPDTLLVHKAAAAKVQESASKLSEAEHQAVAGRADVITRAVLAEMNLLQQQRTDDFKQYMQAYLAGQIDFYAQITRTLEETLKHFDTA